MKAVFLDRDGTLIKNIPYLSDPSLIQLEHRVVPALRALQEDGFELILVTNQSGIGRGLLSEETYKTVHSKLMDIFKKKEITFLDSYYCPFHPTEGIGEYLKDSADRKPNPGMLLKAIEKFPIDVEKSFMIGDSLSDIKAGQSAGVKSILVRTGHGQETLQKEPNSQADHIAEDLYDAVVNYIIGS